MELDSKNLSRLQRVANPRDVWLSESEDFTPWLAENIDVLADELGMTLTVVATEVPVGEFRLDIKAEDAEGNIVVIESQLERTDHSHLGQCLVYASGLNASTIVWIASRFRDEYRITFDWLNERTDLGINFFAVELGVVQIGNSGPRAPVFEIVARPNDWQKAVKTATGASAASGLNALRQDVFAEVMTAVNAKRPSIRIPSRGTGNWIAFASGPFGSWAFTAPTEHSVRVEAYLDTGSLDTTKALYDDFDAERQHWQQITGIELSWEPLPDRRACRIAAYRDFDLANQRAEAIDWLTDTLIHLHDALNEPLRNTAKTRASTRLGTSPHSANEVVDNP